MVHLCRIVYSLNRVSTVSGQNHIDIVATLLVKVFGLQTRYSVILQLFDLRVETYRAIQLSTRYGSKHRRLIPMI